MIEPEPYLVTFTRTQQVMVGVYAFSEAEAIAMVKKDPWTDVEFEDASTMALSEPVARVVGDEEAWPLDEDGHNFWPDR